MAKMIVGAAFPHRLGQPDEFARLAVAMVDNPMLNGQCIQLDAGVRRYLLGAARKVSAVVPDGGLAGWHGTRYRT